jgi:RNA polymerase sigma factor for flagellar operon FliA
MKAASTAVAGWEAYAQTRDPALREELLTRYLPLVKRIASHLLGSLPRSVRLQDLFSSGVMGLLSCLDNYNPELGIKFESYASNRIRGAMMDGLRELDWVPRSVRQKARQVEKTFEGLTYRLGRIPSDEEAAREMKLPMEDYYRLLEEVNITTLLSLDDTFWNSRGDKSSLSDLATDEREKAPDEQVEEAELRERMVELLKELPEQEKLVVALYYYEELTLKEIGEIMGLTESRVSQIHTRAILDLRSRLRQTLQE